MADSGVSPLKASVPSFAFPDGVTGTAGHIVASSMAGGSPFAFGRTMQEVTAVAAKDAVLMNLLREMAVILFRSDVFLFERPFFLTRCSQ